MSPKLKPLILPQLVEERRKRESQATVATCLSVSSEYDPSIDYTSATSITFTTTASSTDLPSPVTPTSSRGHSRYASSTSSFEMLALAIPDHCPSPTQKPGKRILPDVQEDPLEQDDILEQDDDSTMVDENFDLYDCLCDDICLHKEDPDLVQSPVSAHSDDFADYGFGFSSDGDGASSPRAANKKRGGPDSPISSISRLSSRLPSLSRFRNQKRAANLPLSPVSDLSLDSFRLSRDPSRSRSSSISASLRYQLDRANEPPLPPTPALSFFGSSDSIVIPPPIDIEAANAHVDLERDRSMATTPLLPPLMTDSTPLQPQSSPTAQVTPITELPTPLLPSPPLSSKPSVSSFRPKQPSELPAVIQDAWSDRLGHANYTIVPQPYKPAQEDVDALRQLRADWDEARIAYGRHIARIGEHYGHTSKIYNLTEAKWEETQNEWQTVHDDLVDKIADWANLEDEDRVPVGMPKLHAGGEKFPSRGDEDIVGPMMRAATMSTAIADDKKGARFWRTLVDKVVRR